MPAIPHPSPLIACVDQNADITLLLQAVLEEEGLRAITYNAPPHTSPQAVIDFLREATPVVAIYDVGPPYAARWDELQMIQAALPGCRFVVTTTDKRTLDALVAETTPRECFAKPFDLDNLLIAIRQEMEPPVHSAA